MPGIPRGFGDRPTQKPKNLAVVYLQEPALFVFFGGSWRGVGAGWGGGG